MKNEKFLSTVGKGLSLLFLAGLVACGGEGEVVETTEVGEAELDNEMVTAETYDADRFNTTFASTNYYEEWDANDDNMLDRNEYNTGFYDTWDVNNDNRLDENEWNTATRDWGLENETWAEWDTNTDGFLDENEFGTGFADNEWYGEWDTDGNNMLAEREYTDGVFGLWDANDDNMLDENEYGYYNTYYGD